MEPAIDREAIVDEEQLRPLPACYWVLGGTSVLMALYGLLYIGMGLLFSAIPMEGPGGPGDQPPAAMFLFLFGGMGLGFLLLFGTQAALQILTGFWILRRKRRIACLVTAGISCFMVPFGTLIGVFTFLVLARPTVKARFEARHDEAPAVAPVPDTQME